MTAQQAAAKMVEELNHDNNMLDNGGTGFVVTDDQMARLVAGIEKMGLPAMPVAQQDVIISGMVAGEETDVQQAYGALPGYVEVDAVLSEIFDTAA